MKMPDGEVHDVTELAMHFLMAKAKSKGYPSPFFDEEELSEKRAPQMRGGKRSSRKKKR
jgi:hypothetical protein